MKDWLLHNPIADLPGPQFLMVYALAIAGLMVEAFWRRSRRDDSLRLGRPKVPLKPDPLEIAYLRGGENEVTRLVVFDLMRRELVATNDRGTKIVATPASDKAGKLSPLEAEAVDYFQWERTPNELFQSRGLASRLKPLCEPIRETLREQEYIPSAELFQRSLVQWGASSALVVLLGGYKVVVAVAKGHLHFEFLLGYGLVGSLLLWLAYRVPKRTKRGEALLARLREVYQSFQAPSPDTATTTGDDGMLLLAPALFGLQVMAGGPHQKVASLFQASSATSSGCGGGCGSSSSCGGGGGGGGCGGGGGGCGGGGCGGCGA